MTIESVTDSPLLLREVVKSYGERRAVDGLSLEVRPAEIYGLLGPNGAGKTTTISLAAGLMAPDSGEISLLGAGSPQAPQARARLGIAPQGLAIYEELSGRENLEFFARLQGIDRSKLRTQVDRALDFVGLSRRAKDRASSYSGGMKRRLNLAAAIVHEPEIVFLDEPTVGVDPQSRNAIFDNILELKNRGCSILYTTHYMEEAHRLCDRVGIMEDGRILAEGSVSDLVSKHGGPSVVRVVIDGVEQCEESSDPLSHLQRLDPATVESFRVESPNLESVFMKLTGKELRDS